LSNAFVSRIDIFCAYMHVHLHTHTKHFPVPLENFIL